MKALKREKYSGYPAVDLVIGAPDDELRRIWSSEQKWRRKYGRSRCEFGSQCVHCCPICCMEYDFDDQGRLIVKMRFKPKKGACVK